MSYICFMVTRKLVDLLQKYLPMQKALIILGPRQVGKTTLMKNLFNESNASKVWGLTAIWRRIDWS
jgi:predicted AAA+ superfamily ATPase